MFDAIRSPRAVAALFAAVLGFVSATARAIPPPPSSKPPGTTSTPNEPGTPATGLSAWQSNKSTPFVTLATDLGITYLRPKLTFGYGSPFWQFVGIESYVMATNSFMTGSVAYRASFPFLDAIMGVRKVYAFNRRFLTPAKPTYEADDLDLSLHPGGERSVYNAADFEFVLLAPALHGVFYGNAHPVLVWGIPDNTDVYEEVLRVVMKPPMALGLRWGYVYGIGESQNIKAGIVIEHVVVPNRPHNVWRGGPVILIGRIPWLPFPLEGLFAFSPVWYSPDSLGIFHGTYAYFGVLHRWAHRF